ncbi:MAG: hypothetical protein IM592_16285 [Bacteroidetes bacterium]|nr:hypothetical protein [Bacteroidota bacterium]
MLNNWKKYKLGDLIDIKHGYAFKGEFFSDTPTKDVLLTLGNFHFGGGFKAAGENAFDVNNEIIIDLEPYKYICRFSSENKTQYVKLYHQLFNHEELNTIVITFCKTLIAEIVRKLENIK